MLEPRRRCRVSRTLGPSTVATVPERLVSTLFLLVVLCWDWERFFLFMDFRIVNSLRGILFLIGYFAQCDHFVYFCAGLFRKARTLSLP